MINDLLKTESENDLVDFYKNLYSSEKYKDIRVFVVTITSEMATKIMQGNTMNRGIVKRNLLAIKTALLRGEWKLNGDTIRIALDGTVLDGQHRLIGCIETGIPFETFIIYGLDKDVFTTKDVGSTRTVGSMMGLKGYKNANTIASIATLLLSYEKGNHPHRSSIKETKSSMVSYIESKENLINGQVFNHIRPLYHLMSPSYLGFLFCIFYEINSDLCISFFEKLSTGENLSKGNPIYLLRGRLIQNKTSSRKEDDFMKSALFIITWNAIRNNKPIKLLRWNKDLQDYPTAI